MRFYKTVVLDVVGLTRYDSLILVAIYESDGLIGSDLVSKEHTPHIYKWINEKEASISTIEPSFPAVTCVPQTTYLTGKPPSEHGIIANGFYDKEYCEIRNWHQSSKLIRAKRIFETIKEIAESDQCGCSSKPTSFSNCWWFPMYDSHIDYLITPRPQYLQDGGKLADIYTEPASLRDNVQEVLGKFPLHRFWGQMTSIESSKWIAEASKLVDQWHDPTLSLIYLPHLDYCLQKYGPDDTKIVPTHLKEIDEVVHSLIQYYEKAHPNVRILMLSEYGISPVNRVVHLNKELRRAGYAKVRRENGGETLDCGACDAFAMADHQVAHVYLRNPEKDLENVKELIKNIPGVERVLDAKEQNEYYNQSGLGSNVKGGAYHSSRSGDLLVVADSQSWFSYYYWENQSQAPDFARCVAIHRKPGYDPGEMFFRYKSEFFGKLYLFFKLFLVYFLRIRTIVDACPLEGDMIRGSHGRIPKEGKYKPILISKGLLGSRQLNRIRAEDIHDLILKALTDSS